MELKIIRLRFIYKYKVAELYMISIQKLMKEVENIDGIGEVKRIKMFSPKQLKMIIDALGVPYGHKIEINEH